MKNLGELTNDECQDYLRNTFGDDAKFIRLISDSKDIDANGIEYELSDKYKFNESKRVLYFSNPDVISWLYKNDVDISLPLKQLKSEFIDLDETNSILFEYAMEVNKILTKEKKIDERTEDTLSFAPYIPGSPVIDPMDILMSRNDKYQEIYNELKKTQKEMINKI